MPCETKLASPATPDAAPLDTPREGRLVRVIASLDAGVCLCVRVGAQEVEIPLDANMQRELAEVLKEARAADDAMIDALSSHSIH